MVLSTKSQKKRITAVFWVLIAVFIVIAALMFLMPVTQAFRPYFIYIFFAVSAIIFLLGITLMVLAVKLAKEEKGALKTFLILTGASAAGFVVFALLHNLIYGLFIYLFGPEFWTNIGGDEPFFFILAIFVCPITFLIGVIGSIVLFIRKKRK